MKRLFEIETPDHWTEVCAKWVCERLLWAMPLFRPGLEVKVIECLMDEDGTVMELIDETEALKVIGSYNRSIEYYRSQAESHAKAGENIRALRDEIESQLERQRAAIARLQEGKER